MHKILCAPGPHKRLRKTCVWVSPVEARASCGLPRGTGALGAADLGSMDVSPTAESQAGEQLCQRRSCPAVKVLGTTREFPTQGFGKGTEHPPGNLTLKASGFYYSTSTGLGKQTLGGHRPNSVHTRTQEKHERPSQTRRECPGASSRGGGGEWPATESGAWIQQCWPRSFWRRLQLPPVTLL